jgi:hypothetical protein
MVDALHEARRALRAHGTLIDLRPDSSHPPRVFRGRTELGGLYERRSAIVDNHASDRAVARLVREGSLRQVRRGSFWYEIQHDDLAALDRFVASSRRIGGYRRGTHAALATDPERPVLLRRALAYGIYERR